MRGVKSAEEALAAVPGVSVLSPGGPGSQATVSIRGSTTNQVLVLVDGARVSDPSTGRVDFARLGLDAEDIESIEVLRGGAGAQYGADAVGGVIRITTKRSSGARDFAVSLENTGYLPSRSTSGSGISAVAVPPLALNLVDGQTISFRASLPAGFRVSAQAGHAFGLFPYADTNGERRLRTNADILSANTRTSWSGEAMGGTVSASMDVGARSSGVPGTSTMPTPEARQGDFDARFVSSYSTDRFLSDEIAFQSTLYGNFSSLDYKATATSASDLHQTVQTGSDLLWSALFGEKSQANFGLAARYDRLDSSLAKNASGLPPERVTLGAFAEPTFAFGAWAFSPALRYDWTSDFPSGISAGIGVTDSISSGTDLSLNAGTSYRAPSFDDLWWPLSGGASGNPALRAETAYSGDIGYRSRSEDTSFGLTAHARYAHDVILWREGSDGIWRPANFGDALYPGLEIEGSAKRGSWVLSGSYSWLHSFVLSGGMSIWDDRRVPQVAEHSLDASAAWEGESLSATFTAGYRGLRYLTTDNRAYAPASLALGASARWKLGGGFTLSLRGENLLDERGESIPGYPMPGFTLKTGIEYRRGE